ncbi:MAG TPA: HlyD family efflux transporter periplasmic adaptor subunit [Solirubrobacteraceae bacterium]|jgi:macrolide-specific efflux system membrane fusion protein
MAEPRRRPWHPYLLVALAVLVTVLAVSEIGPPASSARTSTQTVTAEQGVVQSTVTGSGNIEPGTDLDVNFQTSGTLSSVDVQVGQHVNKGQLLGSLDQSSAQLTLDQAEQTLTAAQDQLSSAESGSSTTSGSTSGGSSATSTSSSTTSSAASIASAQAAVDSAQASLDNAQTAFNDTNLYAPISGTIVSMAGLSPGDAVSASSTGSTSSSGTSSASSTTSSSSGSSTGTASGTTAGNLGGSSTSTSSSGSGSSSSPFAEIVNTGTMTVTVPFSESDVDKLKLGQAATVTPDALSDVGLGAHVSAISPVGTTSSGVVSYDVTLTLDQSDPSVKPGMSASVAVIVGQAQGVNVPNAAVTGTGSLATVTVLRDAKQTQQQVAVGLRGDSRTQIVSGLSAGEQVVIKTALPSLSSATTSTTSSSTGTLGGTGSRAGGLGGAAGFGGAGGGAAVGTAGGAR